MKQAIILDTGVLVAYFDRRESHHAWAKKKFSEVSPPLLTCESVISEAWHLLKNVPNGTAVLLSFLQRGVLQMPLQINEEIENIAALMRRYANVPMSPADACLVRLSERYASATLLTLDSDFRIYRRYKRQLISLSMPE